MPQSIIREHETFRLKIKTSECYFPKTLKTINFIREEIKDGQVVNSTTYEFFLYQSEINSLVKTLLES